MKLSLVSGACAFVVPFVVQSAMAFPIASGPMGDHISIGPPVDWHTTADPYWEFVEPDGSHSFGQMPGPSGSTPFNLNPFTDGHGPLLTAPPVTTHPSAHFYFSWDSAVIGNVGNLNVTIFFGDKIGDYPGDVGPMTGFDPAQFAGLRDAGVINFSGNVFPFESHSVLQVSQLSEAFPLFNLSDWSGTGNVDVFQVSVPISTVVPEPTALTALLAGGMLLSRRRR